MLRGPDRPPLRAVQLRPGGREPVESNERPKRDDDDPRRSRDFTRNRRLQAAVVGKRDEAAADLSVTHRTAVSDAPNFSSFL